MTVGELKEKIKDIPDDFVVTCTKDESFPDVARVYEVTDVFTWKSWGPDELRIVHSDDTIY